ncbi:hypothetical protein [Actinoplanes awajinensis]|uniref:Uncharacterized protein n=1 Tax=Actinoplanes awajinensis subsp. mycoplanecinus TaxID=135947 RepID=A0A0X3V5Q8_9ACTN|nr:hypothetical protein [Actinoplanes awajinensis]KUL40070.1 hypothetical protein ADL15_08500 [Actinoplanes awajinensis subsp. mycoplanecinus]
MTGEHSRRAAPDRARKRAVRALAAELGVAYSVAARLLAAQVPVPVGRRHEARFPVGGDEHRAWMFAAREHRTFHARVSDTRLAAELPLGRAAHLVRRFPPLREADGHGPLYAGEGRETTIAMLYAVLMHESPALLPQPDELAWAAELGEEAAVDISCAGLDRAARQLLEQDGWRLWARVEAALTAGEGNADRQVRDAAITLGGELRSRSLRGSLDGARHILDALLVEPYDGQPPGSRVHVAGRCGTVVGVDWAASGAPVSYQVRLDDETAPSVVPASAATLGPEPVAT